MQKISLTSKKPTPLLSTVSWTRSVIFLVIFVILSGAAYFSAFTNEKEKKQVSNESTPFVFDTSTQSSEPVADTVLDVSSIPLKENELFLRKYKNEDYFLVWKTYDEKSAEFIQAQDSDDAQDLYGEAQVFLRVKNDSEINNDFLVDQPFLSKHPYAEVVSVLAAPKNSSKVLVTVAHEGTDGKSTFLLDLVTRKLTNTLEYEQESGYYSCSGIPPHNTFDQSKVIFSCRDEESGQESLFSFEYSTEKKTKIATLPNGQTFNCEPKYGTNLQLVYTATDVTVSICESPDHNNKNMELTPVKTIVVPME